MERKMNRCLSATLTWRGPSDVQVHILSGQLALGEQLENGVGVEWDGGICNKKVTAGTWVSASGETEGKRSRAE